MRALLTFLFTLGILYGGYLFWQQTSSSSSLPDDSSQKSFTTPKLSLQDDQSVLSKLESVLGASISTGIETVNETLSTVTQGRSDPIINEAISNFQKELSKLPEDQVKKIQYNYCKSIVEEYEKVN